MTVPELDLNETFLHALRLMEETEKSLFVTGKAGTGKPLRRGMLWSAHQLLNSCFPVTIRCISAR
jgi:hypothetical protein